MAVVADANAATFGPLEVAQNRDAPSDALVVLVDQRGQRAQDGVVEPGASVSWVAAVLISSEDRFGRYSNCHT